MMISLLSYAWIAGLGLISPFAHADTSEQATARIAVYKQTFERIQKDVDLSCINQGISQGRELNAKAAMKRIDIHWGELKSRMKEIHEFLNVPEKVLSSQISRDLASLESQWHENNRKLDRKMRKQAILQQQSSIEEKTQFLETLSEAMKKRQSKISDPLADDWVATEVKKAQSELTDLSLLSEKYQGLWNQAKTCYVTAGPIGTEDRQPHWPLGMAYPGSPEAQAQNASSTGNVPSSVSTQAVSGKVQ